MQQYDALKLKNQLCFPLYAAAKEVVKRYTPFLEPLALTYTQYIAMMVLWERETLSVKELGCALTLDSGTLTPLLKKLEKQGLIARKRDEGDERIVNVTLTDAGWALRERAQDIPRSMGACLPLTAQEGQTLYALLYKLLDPQGGTDDGASL